jgi:hypothetical protein
MSVLIGNLMYWAGAVVGALFVTGAAAVLLAGLGESPSMAAGFAIALAVLFYGFGWSSRCLLQGRERRRV